MNESKHISISLTMRLNLMMFLEFFVLGSTMPIISLYLKNKLHFSGAQIGAILSLSAFSSFVSPFLSAVVADRLLSAERLLSLLHLVAAVLLFFLQSFTTFTPVLILYLLYWSAVGPTTALTTAITFHHTPKGGKQFGGIRLWGTLGWIAAAWTFKLFFSSIGDITATGSGNLQGALIMGICGSVILSIFSLSLPLGLKNFKKKIVLLPRDSLQVILHPPTLLLAFFAILISMADRMYLYGGGPFLKSLGFPEKDIMSVLSIGQVPEILGLALLGYCITRTGIKRTLLIGTTLEITRFLLFSRGVTGIPLYVAISLHGLTYAFFFVTASIYIDKNSTPQSRSGAHQYIAMLVGGSGALLGNLFAGLVADYARVGSGCNPSFTDFWTVPFVLSLIGTAGIALFFKETKTTRKHTIPEP